MKDNLLTAGAITSSLLLSLLIAVIVYVHLSTPLLPKFFPTELKQVRDDLGLVIVQPQGAPNPDYHPSYANQQSDPNSTN